MKNIIATIKAFFSYLSVRQLNRSIAHAKSARNEFEKLQRAWILIRQSIVSSAIDDKTIEIANYIDKKMRKTKIHLNNV